MSEPRELLVGLLEYIKEQAKVVDPRGFVLGRADSFLRKRVDVAGLIGVEFDLRVEADHVWMRVAHRNWPSVRSIGYVHDRPADDQSAYWRHTESDQISGAKL